MSLVFGAVKPASPAIADSAAVPVSPARPDTAATTAAPDARVQDPGILPEQIGLWGLLGILYPLLLVVGIRLLRIGTRRWRVWARRRLDAWIVWLRSTGLTEGWVLSLHRSGRTGVRLLELAIYLICIYAFSLNFFLLIPGTRDLGVDMASQFWPPLRAAILLVMRTFTYLAFAVIVLFLARWAIPRLHLRLGAGSLIPPRRRNGNS